MQYSKVTGTDLSASRLVLGTDSFGTLVSEPDAFALMDRYVEAGGNVIDTASVYADWLGLGKSISEKTIGKWLKARNNRSQVILATKGGHYDLDTQAPRLDYHSVREDFENSLRNLQTDHIDIYYLHKDDESQSPESLMDMLQEAAPAQQARYLGVSNWSYDRIRRANAYAREKGLRPIIASQIQHSIASANIDQFGITAMDAASYRQYAQDELSIFAYSSQAKGFFAILEKGGAEALSEATRAMYWNEENCKRSVSVGVEAVPAVLSDDSDRNRTSPFAFTGNKFEFRMVGSAQSVALANITLNAILCDSLDYFASILEKSEDIEATVRKIAVDTYNNHKRIIMNGDNYSEEWKIEAERRGLPQLSNALDAAMVWEYPETVDLFSRFGIFSKLECDSRYEIALEHFNKIVLIEAKTMLEMMQRQIIPAVISAAGKNADSLKKLRDVGLENAEIADYAKKLSDSASELYKLTSKLRNDVSSIPGSGLEKGIYMRDVIRNDMEAIRECSDAAENMVDEKEWPMPTYTDLMHRV